MNNSHCGYNAYAIYLIKSSDMRSWF